MPPLRNRLRVLRAERQWSQADLAARVGVSRNTITSIEIGKYEPSLGLGLRLARAFELRVEDVFEEVEDPAGTLEEP